MTESNAVPPKPSPRDLAREARRLERIRQLESTEPRIIELRASPIRSNEPHFDPSPDPKEAA
jgi:hypothetical protein